MSERRSCSFEPKTSFATRTRPGAFTTFDGATGILFSSDIFGGYTDEWSLLAEDESYFEALRPFHEHYMPSRDVLVHGLNAFRELPIQLIAPQHGSMIPGRLVPYMIERLAGLHDAVTPWGCAAASWGAG